MLNVLEISEQLGVSKQTVYRYFNNFNRVLKPHIKVRDGSKHLTREGFELLCRLTDNEKNVKMPENETAETVGTIPIEQYELLSHHVKMLEKQLEISQKNLEDEKRLHANTQELLLISQKQIVLLNEPELKGSESDRRSFLKKLFKL